MWASDEDRLEYNRKQREYNAAHKDKLSEYNKKARRKLQESMTAEQWEEYKAKGRHWQRHEYLKNRLACLEAYGGQCSCCFEKNPEFLGIDHIKGDGAAHRRSAGRNIYRILKHMGYPKDNYRILCHNCNMSYGLYGYCPHQEIDAQKALPLQTNEKRVEGKENGRINSSGNPQG